VSNLSVAQSVSASGPSSRAAHLSAGARRPVGGVDQSLGIKAPGWGRFQRFGRAPPSLVPRGADERVPRCS